MVKISNIIHVNSLEQIAQYKVYNLCNYTTVLILIPFLIELSLFRENLLKVEYCILCVWAHIYLVEEEYKICLS